MIRLTKTRGLTLIELLLVLTILAALAASAASFVEEADDQLRYQDTQNRLTSLREGILGRAAAGRAKHDGFVADLGRLPGTVKELLDPGTLPAWQIDPPTLIDLATVPATGLGYGWRGPYVPSLPRVSGERAYPDGWGNLGLSGEPADDFGWRVQLSGAELTIQSRGRGGLVGGPPSDSYAADYPNGPLVLAADHTLDLNGWSVRAQISAASAATVRLRLRYFGEVAGAPSQVALLSDPLTLLAGTNAPQTFTFNLGGTKLVPWGPKALDLVDDGGAPLTEFNGPGDGGYADLSGVQRLELYPRASLPTDLPAGWSLP